MLRTALLQGDDVDIVYLAARERGTVEAVEDGGRTLVIVAESGKVLHFRLFASGHFMTADRGCRLVPGTRS
jgi:hypothetical protein